MPAVPAFAAVFAIGAAGAATAGAIAGTVAIATAGFAVLGAVGATLGAIGSVTKNKTLQMVGLGLGVVGGIGGIASSAGVFGSEAGSIFTPASSGGASLTGDTGATFADSLTPATTGGSGQAAGFVDNGTWDAAPAAAAGAPAANLSSTPTAALDPSAQLAMAPNAANATDQVSAAATAAPDGAGASQSDIAGGSGLGSPKVPSASAGTEGQTQGLVTPDKPLGGVTTQPQQSQVSPFDSGQPATAGAAKTASVATTGTDQVQAGMDPSNPAGWLGRQFDGITAWAKENPVLASGLVSGGFGLLKGLVPTTTDSTNNANNATAQANLALARLRDQQQANIAAPKAVAYSPPVGTAPGVGNPAAALAGLINRAPTSAVTGATA